MSEISGMPKPNSIRSFEKGLADKGGCREEILPMPEIAASFLCPFSYAPLGEGGHITGEHFLAVFGVCLSPTPSRQPLFETSDSMVCRTYGLHAGHLSRKRQKVRKR